MEHPTPSKLTLPRSRLLYTVIITGWLAFSILADIAPSLELVIAGVITLVSVGALLGIGRVSGKGAVASKAKIWKGIEFFLVATAFGIIQMLIESSNLSIAPTFGVVPQGSTLVGAGAFAMIIGLVYTFWGLGIKAYPYRGYGLKKRLYQPTKEFILIGLGALDAILLFFTLNAVYKWATVGFAFDNFSPYESVALILSAISVPLLFFDKIETRRLKFALWIFTLLPVAVATYIRLFQLGIFRF